MKKNHYVVFNVCTTIASMFIFHHMFMFIFQDFVISNLFSLLVKQNVGTKYFLFKFWKTKYLQNYMKNKVLVVDLETIIFYQKK